MYMSYMSAIVLCSIVYKYMLANILFKKIKIYSH